MSAGLFISMVGCPPGLNTHGRRQKISRQLPSASSWLIGGTGLHTLILANYSLFIIRAMISHTQVQRRYITRYAVINFTKQLLDA
jgi:hypothetical protein